MTFKERLEENATLWLLGSLLAGFLSGVAAYKSVQEMAEIKTVSKTDFEHFQQIKVEHSELQARVSVLEKDLNTCSTQLRETPKVECPKQRYKYEGYKPTADWIPQK